MSDYPLFECQEALAEAKAEAAALRKALISLGQSYGEQLCFCSMAIGNPMLREHTPQCQQASAALAAVAGQPPPEKI